MAGLILDPWQQFVIVNVLGERPDGKWSAFEVGLEVSRQNGKGGVLEARELAGLFLFGERLIIHSAHEFPTSLEAFYRMLELLESCPDFDRRVKRVLRSHGEEGITLKGGQRLRYRTRTGGGARGFSGDCVIFDEAMDIPDRMHSALFPTLSARPNPQIFYTGSAVDQESMPNGRVFAKVRERGIRGDDPRLAYFGYGADFDHPDAVDPVSAVDPELWAQTNPALEIRIPEEYVAAEQRSMSPRGFAVERLGVGDWPDPEDRSDRKISDEAWLACMDRKSKPTDPVCFAFDVTPDRKAAAICVAGRRRDSIAHVEVVEVKQSTGWVAQRLVELVARHNPLGVMWSEGSPAASLLPALEDAGVQTTPVRPSDHAKACGVLYDAVEQTAVRHLGTTELAIAVKGAVAKPVGDAWVWSRKSSRVNIAPLVGCTLALWGLLTVPPRERLNVADYRIGRL